MSVITGTENKVNVAVTETKTAKEASKKAEAQTTKKKGKAE